MSVRGFSPFWRIGYFRYFALLLFGPFLILLAYRLRRFGSKTILLIFGICGICVLLPGFFGDRHDIPACAVLVVSVAVTLLMMIHRDIFSAEGWTRRRLYGIALAGLVLVGSLFGCTEDRREMLQCFIRPDANIRSTWDDTYNSALIRRLLSETPLHRGIDLGPGILPGEIPGRSESTPYTGQKKRRRHFGHGSQSFGKQEKIRVIFILTNPM